MIKLTKLSITDHRKVSPGVYIISFKREFNFVPGQIIGITNDPNMAPRLYSICSNNEAKNIDILYQVKSDGQLTPALEKNKVGDALWVTTVQGKFTYANEPAWWIATGTGIAPFYSMYLSGQKPTKLIQGGRLLENIYFFNELKNLPDYVVCCSQDKGTGVFEGRLTNYLKSYDKLPNDINYYLCGSAEMVVDVRNLLIEKGVGFNKIITEIYF